MSRPYQSPIEQLFASTDVNFFCDHPDYADRHPDALKACPQYSLLISRQKLREFCISRKITCPAFFAADQFAKLSAWAVKVNRFPMTMKSATNLADGEAGFILKAFRELPDFHEQISAIFPGAIILEEFINPKARVELTFFNGVLRICAQTGLEKSMKLRHTWRAFPIRLPEKILGEINDITGQFSELLSVAGVPIRFSFGLTGASPVLLSINAGFNRPEYHPEWRNKAGLATLGDCSAKPSDGEKLCKVLFFPGFKEEEVDENRLKIACDSTLVDWAAVEGQIIVFICSEKASTLLEESKRVDAMFKHLAD